VHAGNPISDLLGPFSPPNDNKNISDRHERPHPQAQLRPEVALDILGADFRRVGDIKTAIEIFKLNLLAYPNSADANDDLAGAYLADGQNDLARQYAEKALALLASHNMPASSWSDTEPKRDTIRRSAERTLTQVAKKER
jgi:tetratricopeptide (TPR) repeat protein